MLAGAEQVLDAAVEHRGKLEGEGQGWVVAPFFQGDDRLPGYTEQVGQRLLRESAFLAVVAEVVLH